MSWAGFSTWKAFEEGYSSGRESFHGYYFKILKGQGPAAANGAINYVVEDVMIGGFALVAVPVEYRVTAVKTFIVNYDDVVYQKDLGPDSLEIVKKMGLYNPHKTWQATNDAWPESVEYGENANCGYPILCHAHKGMMFLKLDTPPTDWQSHLSSIRGVSVCD